MNKTPIQWTWATGPDGKLIPMSGSTWNPLLGCKEVSPGCMNCYAARLIGVRFSKNPKLPMYHDIATTAANGHPHFTGARRLLPDRLDEPLRTEKGRKIFVCDMGDLFFEGHPFEDIAAVFGVMAASPRHTFQVLTKRIDRAAEFFSWVTTRAPRALRGWVDVVAEAEIACNEAVGTRGAHMSSGERIALHEFAEAAIPYRTRRRLPYYPHFPWPLPNVWIGTTVEDRDRKNRIDVLRTIPAVVRFLSIEPLLEDLGPVDWTGIHWIIVGGESGKGARPFVLAWMRSLRDQCSAAGVAFFPKQLGSDPVQRADEALAYGSIANLNDSHGGDESEWPTDLQGRRAFPVPA